MSSPALHELQQGQAFQQAGRRGDARRCYERALSVDPRNAVAHYLLGTLALADRQPAPALDHFRAALAAKPDFLEACAQLAATSHALGRLADAITFYRRALTLRPDFAEVHCNLGNALQAGNDLPAAILAYREALRLKPGFAEAHNSLGVALKAAGQLEEAVASYRAALAAQPRHLAALANLALALRAQEKWADALTASEQALALDRDHAPTLLNLGGILEAQGRPDAALDAYRRILQRDPDHVGALCNLGVLRQARGETDAAVASYTRALKLQPDHVEALTNLGTAHQARNDLPAALASYTRALALQPDLGQVRFNLGVCQLLAGDFASGWRNYEARWEGEQRKFRRSFPQPLWLGESSLTGRTLLVYPEQGLGDTLQFVRYVPLLAARGATVILEVQPPLRRLLDGFPGARAVIARGEPLPAFDLHCPLLSLPLACGTELATVPAPRSYLDAPPVPPGPWSSRLAPTAGTTRRIGLVWSGGPHHKSDHLRSIPLEQFARLVRGTDARFMSLQKEVKPTDAATLAATPEITSFAAHLTDFADTAALLASLDLVISVDTSVAHLAGALGKPTWLLLPFSPDWRWLLHRSDSPWYPTMKLFRQPTPGDWDSVVADVRRELFLLPRHSEQE